MAFEIPESWELIRLGNVCQFIDGQKRTDEKYNNLDARYMRGKSSPTVLENGKYVEEGTLLILVDGENSGEIFIAPENGYMGSTFKVLWISSELYNRYVLLFIELYRLLLKSSKKGAAIPHLNKELFFSLILPLPPLPEQHRIVAKIEELIPYIEKYEQAETQLTELNNNFPELLKKSILQEAVQGKLVPQDPNDEPASKLLERIRAEKQALIKAGKIKKDKHESVIVTRDKIPYEIVDGKERCISDEVPFEIPESWCWCRLKELSTIITKGSSPKWQGVAYVENNGILFITSENVGEEQILLEKTKYVESKFNDMHPSSILQQGDLLTNIVGASIGRTAVFNIQISNANINQAVCIVRLVDSTFGKYLVKFMNCPAALKMMTNNSVESARANLSLASVGDFLIPLPPIEEQKRIVTRIEELIKYCEML